MTIPYPQNTPWELWVAIVIGYNPELHSQVSPLLSWRDFGDRLTLLVPQTPRTSPFEDWRSWGTALAQAVGGN